MSPYERDRADPNVLKEIVHFQRLFDGEQDTDISTATPLEVDAPKAEAMKSTRLADLLLDLEKLLQDESCGRGRLLVLEILLDRLREIRTEDEAEAVVKALITGGLKKGSVFTASSERPTVSAPPAPRSLNDNHVKLHGPSSSTQHPGIKAPPLPPPAPPPPPPPPYVMRTGFPNGSSPQGKVPSPPTPPSFALNPPKFELPESMKPQKAPNEALKMKTIMWTKIAPSAVLDGQDSDSVWGELARQSTKLQLDFDLIDGMFAITPSQSQAVGAVVPSVAQCSKRKGLLVDLLTPKRSQNVTITLKQFRDLDALISDLRENKVGRFDAEVLRTLKTILPDSDEVAALRRYTGEVSQLAPACSFFLQLLDIPDYRLRIECMMLRLEFHRIMEEVVPQIHVLKLAATELRRSKALRRLLLLLVNIGNYLNSSSTHGNAAGFKLSSLWRVIDHKSAKGSSSLLHLLAKMEPDLPSDLDHELPDICVASESSLDEIKTNLRSLGEQCTSVSNQLKSKQGNEFCEIREYLSDHCHYELLETNKSLNELLIIQDELAHFFCENKASFKIEECFKIFKNLVIRLRQALQENDEKDKRMLRKQRATNVCEAASEGVEKKADCQPSDDDFLATLEKGQTHHIRKRGTVRANEVGREREGERKIRRAKETKSGENSHVDENSVSKHLTAGLPLRTSAVHNRVIDLNDYVEILEKQQLSPHGLRRSTVHSTEPPPTQNCQTILLSIPPESDASTTSARSSPKSISDEGFESEKDRDRPSDARSRAIPAADTRTVKVKSKTPENMKTTTPAIVKTDDRPLVSVKALSSSSKKLMPLSKIARPSTNCDAVFSEPAASPSCSTVRPKTSQIVPTPWSRHVTPRNVAAKTTQPLQNGNTSALRKLSLAPSKPVADPAAVKRNSTTLAAKSTLQTLAARRMSTPHPTNVAAPSSRRANQTVIKRAVSVTEQKRDVTLKPQVSTSSRPSLIKTGSIPQSQNLPKMAALEKPRPLRRTTENTSEMGRTTPRPKWV
ncbi:hypothetical protein Q1695_015157 [Nippostrongylus brasiliensis]|nr:hypothetical protein Q1695_015157 [Nippostrongylus brasiliensis]